VRIHPSSKGKESATLGEPGMGGRFGGVDGVTLFYDLPTREGVHCILYLLHGV